jgi:hypothetical protein
LVVAIAAGTPYATYGWVLDASPAVPTAIHQVVVGHAMDPKSLLAPLVGVDAGTAPVRLERSTPADDVTTKGCTPADAV